MAEFNANLNRHDNAVALLESQADAARAGVVFARSWVAHEAGISIDGMRAKLTELSSLPLDKLQATLPVVLSSIAEAVVTRDGAAHENGVARVAQCFGEAFTNLSACSIRTRQGTDAPKIGKNFTEENSHMATRFVSETVTRYALACWRYAVEKADFTDPTKIVADAHGDALDNPTTHIDAVGGLTARETALDHATETATATATATPILNADAAAYADRVSVQQMRVAMREDRRQLRQLRELLNTQARLLRSRDKAVSTLKAQLK